MSKYYIYTTSNLAYQGKWQEVGSGNAINKDTEMSFCCRVDEDGRVYVAKSSMFTLYQDRPTLIYNIKRTVQERFGVIPEFRKKI